MARKRPLAALLKDWFLEFPALVKLVYRLLKDDRVSTLDKAILGGIVLYILNPMDLLPDAILGLGQIDDLYLIALGPLRLMHRTEEDVLREHWEGKHHIVPLLDDVIAVACFICRKICAENSPQRSSGNERFRPSGSGHPYKLHSFTRAKNCATWRVCYYAGS